ncbi:hypothetical protein AHAS_Ahas15G0163900 [Arachis hypogaea]
MLKPFHGPLPSSASSTAELSSSLQLYPTMIVASRIASTPTEPQIELLVDWNGIPHHETTWMDVVELRRQFLDMDLEDKVIIEGGYLM